MGFDDKIKNAAGEAAGKVREWVGDKTDNEQLQAQGKRDQAVVKARTRANLRQLCEGLCECVRDAVPDSAIGK